MTDYQYARKREGLAWHAIDSRVGLNTWKAVCGHPALDPVVEVLPWNEDPCGSCLRITNRRAEQAAQRAKPNTDEPFEQEQFEDDASTQSEMAP